MTFGVRVAAVVDSGQSGYFRRAEVIEPDRSTCRSSSCDNIPSGRRRLTSEPSAGFRHVMTSNLVRQQLTSDTLVANVVNAGRRGHFLPEERIERDRSARRSSSCDNIPSGICRPTSEPSIDRRRGDVKHDIAVDDVWRPCSRWGRLRTTPLLLSDRGDRAGSFDTSIFQLRQHSFRQAPADVGALGWISTRDDVEPGSAAADIRHPCGRLGQRSTTRLLPSGRGDRAGSFDMSIFQLRQHSFRHLPADVGALDRSTTW